MIRHSGFILAVAGAAVGLGNIWRFPYMAGENGGSAFLLFYLLFVLLLGIPAMAAEILVGRAGRSTPTVSLRALAKQGNGSWAWEKVSLIGMLAALMVLSFYSVVAGWGGYYLTQTLSGGLDFQNAQQLGSFFDSFLAKPHLLILFHSLFLIITLSINGQPVAKGLERLNAFLMPLLYGLLIVLVIYGSGFPGFSHAIDYLFSPDWQNINMGVLIEAMGHAFFTLAVGACCLMAYGAYMPAKQSILGAVFIVVILDLIVSLLAGVATFTIVFSDGLDPASGPGLIFITLPKALNAMPYGDIVLPLFFILFVIATWTSSVNLAEPLVASTATRLGVGRGMASVVVGFVVWCLGLIPALSFNLWSGVSIAGHGLFDLWTGFATNILLPVTALLILVFVGWVVPWGTVAEQLGFKTNNGGTMEGMFRLLFRFIAPGMVLTIFVFGLLS
ncbi:sodium-dependent transporter [Parendozoicomonas haliclonae]|nr:sodium-dependent transporter [Parendozoicomonas haliclonae]